MFKSKILKIQIKKSKKKFINHISLLKKIVILLNLSDLRQNFRFRDQVILCVLYASEVRVQELCDVKGKKYYFPLE